MITKLTVEYNGEVYDVFFADASVEYYLWPVRWHSTAVEKSLQKHPVVN